MIAEAAVSNIGTTDAGDPLPLDLDRLIGTHACVVANSGAGKSGAIRRLLETTHGHVQHVVLDIEDEFYTLRERFDYVIAGGDGGDAPATVEGAEGLALATLTHGFSLIVQLNDLSDDAPAFVGRFLTALISAPRELWRPLLVVIDEVQRFAPSTGSTDATKGIRALLQRGRKRGFTAVLASLAMSEINPRVRGLVNNWMLGRVGQSLDRDTMARQLGFKPSSPQALGLQALEPRRFWAFGPALTPIPTLFRVADVETTPVLPGQAKITTPPPPEALRAILAGIATATAEASHLVPTGDVRMDGEATKSIDQMLSARDAHIAELQADLAATQAHWTAATRSRLSLIQKLSDLVHDAIHENMFELSGFAEGVQLSTDVEDAAPGSTEAADHIKSDPDRDDANLHDPRKFDVAAFVQDAKSSRGAVIRVGGPPPPADTGEGALRGRKALAALVVRNTGLTERQWAWTAGFAVRGGTWSTYKSALRAAGLVEERDGRWYPTDAAFDEFVDGIAIADFPALGDELARKWGKRIRGGGRIVEVLLKRWPHAVSRDSLAADLNMAATGGTFGTYLSRVRSAGLLHEQGKRVRLHPELMDRD